MEDNDIVLSDDTVSRYHCKIVQDDTGYVLVDHRSTNGTFINKVRVREAFLKPGCTIAARPEPSSSSTRARKKVEIVPSRSGSLRRADRRQREDARDLLDPREDRADRDDRRHRRRDRHRQGGRRAGDPRAVAARAGRARRVRLRRGPAEPDRERAVRPREGQLHRRDDDAHRACSSRPTAARCSSTRSASCRSICSPSSCARSSSARSAASARPSRSKVDVRIIAATNRNLEDEVRAGPVPRGSVLPAQRRARCTCRRCASAPTTSRCSSSTSSTTARTTSSPTARSSVRGVVARRDGPRCRPTRGRATCASWSTSIERAVSFCERELIELSRSARLRAHAKPRREGARAPRGADRGPPRPRCRRRRRRRPTSCSRGRHVQGREGALGRDVRARLHPAAARRNNGNISHAAREADIDRKYFRKLMKKYDIEGGGRRRRTDDTIVRFLSVTLAHRTAP